MGNITTGVLRDSKVIKEGSYVYKVNAKKLKLQPNVCIVLEISDEP